MDQEIKALIETIIRLSTNTKVDPEGPASKFLEKLEADSDAHPLDNKAVILCNCSVEVSRSARNRNKTIHISDIRSLIPSNGDASKALRYLCDLADECGVDLDLYAMAYVKGRLTTKQLIKWYERYGFVGYGMDDDGEDMIRRHA
jgi:hypothetical protein